MVVQFIVFLTLSTLICRGTDISKCFSESFGIRDNESRLYLYCIYFVHPPKRQKTYLRTCAPSEVSDQPVHSPRMQMNNKDWSDCADAQANLNLHWEYLSNGTFSHFLFHSISCERNMNISKTFRVYLC